MARAPKVSESFGEDYADARERFVAAARERGAALTSHPCPAPGPGGLRLSTDVARIGPADARRALISLSATHGVEGFAGSGIQCHQLRSGAYERIPADTAVWLVHAVTPWGFAWERRVNEDGVDVCRNFVDFEAPLPRNPLFDTLAKDLVPRDWTGPARDAADGRLAAALAEIGIDAFKAALARGQYDHPQAPFYGGRAPTWSNALIRGLLRGGLAAARDVVLLDYHAGLGERGTGQLLCLRRPGEDGYARARACWGAKLVSVFTAETVAYETTGDILAAVDAECPRARVTSATYEFGTAGPAEVLQALRADHWLHAYGDRDAPLARAIRRDLRDAFYCDADDWRESVAALAADAEREALALLAES